MGRGGGVAQGGAHRQIPMPPHVLLGFPRARHDGRLGECDTPLSRAEFDCVPVLFLSFMREASRVRQQQRGGQR